MASSVVAQQVVTTQSLSKEFTTSCFTPMAKEMVAVLRTADKGVPNFQNFTNAKKYLKDHAGATDTDRYNDLIATIFQFVSDSGKVDHYLLDKTTFFTSLTEFIQSDEIFEVVSDLFTKGQYAKIVDKINRILNPDTKKDDEVYEAITDLNPLVQQYSMSFEDTLKSFSESGGHLYSQLYMLSESETSEDIVKSVVYELCKGVHDFFGIYKEETDHVKVFVASVRPLALDCTLSCDLPIADNFAPTDLTEFTTAVKTNLFEVISPDTFVSLMALKKIFVTRSNVNRFVDFSQMLEMVSGRTPLSFYKASYVENANFAEIKEESLPNILKGVLQGFEEQAKNALTVFVLDGSAGNLVLTSYWLTKGSIESVVKSDFDREAYTWETITAEQFVGSMDVQGSVDTIVLH